MIEKRLTITMPVFERKDFFLEALNSALNQTVKCDILVIDNCSSHDYFKQICQEKGVNYIKNETNIGLFPNWNKCMDKAETDFAMILQDDCTLELDFVESFQNTLNKYPDLDFYYTDFNMLDLDTKIKTKHYHTFPFGYSENGIEVIEYAAKYGLGLLYSFILKKEKFTEYYYKFHGSNDWLWIYSNIADFKIYGDKKKLVNYGTHPLQDSSNSNTHLQCMLTITYIYDYVISNVRGLSEKSQQDSIDKSKIKYSYFLSIIEKKKFKEIILDNNIYSNYLVARTKNNMSLIKMYLILPTFFRKNLFKVLRRLGYYKNF